MSNDSSSSEAAIDEETADAPEQAEEEEEEQSAAEQSEGSGVSGEAAASDTPVGKPAETEAKQLFSLQSIA